MEEQRKNINGKGDAEMDLLILQTLAMRRARSIIEDEGKMHFLQFFAELVRLYGDAIRPYAKSIYAATSMNVCQDVFDEMDEPEMVRKYDENTVFGDRIYKKMLNICYPSYGGAYPPIEFSISEEEYKKDSEWYHKLSEEIIEMIIINNGIEERLKKEYRYHSLPIATQIYQEFVNTGVEETIISEWDTEDIEHEIYVQNLTPEERKEYIEEIRDELVERFLRILKKDKCYYCD